jgi:hypothetical protein
MSSDTIGLIVGLLGLALGVYQSRRDFRRLSKKIGKSVDGYARKHVSVDDYVRKRVEAMFERSDFYIQYPSALLSQYVRSIFAILVIWTVKEALVEPALKDGFFAQPIELAIKFFFIFFLAKITADTVSISSEIRERAIYHFRKERDQAEG